MKVAFDTRETLDILYPNFPNCGLEGYKNKKCIAEGCRYADDGDFGYLNCPYFNDEYKKRSNR